MPEPESDVREMLQRLGRALINAAARSDEVTDAVRRIRREGYSLYLIVDPGSERPRGPQLELTTRPRDAASARERAIRRAAARERAAEAGAAVAGGERTAASPAFRLDGSDVEFLASIGIDPARPAARRRRNQSP